MTGPERFGDIVLRHFPRLKETAMTETLRTPLADDEPALPAADDHYRVACDHIAEAEKPGTPIAEVHARIELAHARIAAGMLDVAMYPPGPAPVEGGDEERL